VRLLESNGLLAAVNIRAFRGLKKAAAETRDDGTGGSNADGDDGSDGDGESVAPQPKRAKPNRMSQRALQPKEAIFMVLMRLRTGLDLIDIHALFNIGYSTACQYFAVYVTFLRDFLIAEFPMPSEEQLRRAEPESFQKAFPGDNVQLIIDAHEQQCEESANLEARRTLWSDYKHRCTNKFLGACTPCGACVFASTNYGGKCDDKTLTTATGIIGKCYPGWMTLADKGFMMSAEFAAVNHKLRVPSHAQVGVATFSRDESRWTNKIGKTRIHIERMFKRAQVRFNPCLSCHIIFSDV
jgi:hypothetical protein